MAKALIVYSTRKEETRKIADLIAEGLRLAAVDVTLANANDIKKESDLAGYDAYIFGSPTYHGDMTNSMKTFLFLAEKADLAGKTGGAFGAFGWSGEAPERIFETMTHIFNMDMTDGPLMLKSSELGGGIKMAQDYGKQVAAKIT
ncbi:MAG: flavodoxin domain-containing protein [Thermodesulfobacteriota bacterium]|nr:flavodoxin domain-containing protein [Thermodesulfobacteriota bacterium]